MNVLDVTVDTHVPSPLHASDRDWRESNCYVDVWFEVLGALGLEAHACLGFALGAEFEHDQWTFHKPGFDDLHELYGIRVEELNLWRGILDHCLVQVRAGRLPLLEVDTFFLPDATLEHHVTHGKTTIAVNAVDPVAGRLGYFHNCAYHELAGDDFRGLFRLDPQTGAQLPPYCETIKLDRVVRRSQAELKQIASSLLRRHLDRAPDGNPFHAFAPSLKDTVAWLVGQPEQEFHGCMFATLRQCGSAYELAARHLAWLGPERAPVQAAEAFSAISGIAKRMILKIARMVQSGRVKDVHEDVAIMAREWERGFRVLRDGIS